MIEEYDTVFYDEKGKPLSLYQVYEQYAKHFKYAGYAFYSEDENVVS